MISNINYALLICAVLCVPCIARDEGVMTFDQAKQRADKGDAFAQAVVAMHYQIGWETEKNVKQAARYAHASAKAKHALGLFRVGTMLRNGEGFSKDEKKGLELQGMSYKALKDAKDPYSITATAIMIFQGKVAGQSIDENERRRVAAGLYKQAADMGFAPAQFNYAMALNDGHGVKKNPILFDKYINAAIESRYPLAENFEIKKKSSHIGAADGARWAYEFLDLTVENFGIMNLSALGNSDLILSTEDWIVTSAFTITAWAQGYTIIRFYDSRSMKMVNAISVPNEVKHIDWSEDRKQFVLVTYSSHVNPADIGASQAIVLVDLANKIIERVPIWERGLTNLDGNYCAPLWDKNHVRIFYNIDYYRESEPLPRILSSNQFFNDIKFTFHKTAEAQIDPKISSNSVNTEALYLAGIANPKIKQVPVGGVRAVVAEEMDGVTILRHSQPGNLQKINISDLSMQSLITAQITYPQVGIFKNGVIHAVSGNDVHLLSATSSKVVSIPTPEIIRASPSPGGGEKQVNLTRANYIKIQENSGMDEDETNMQVFFGSESGYCFTENEVEKEGKVFYIKIDSDGNLIHNSINVPNTILLRVRTKVRIDPDRESIGLAFSKPGEILYQSGTFNEFSLADSKLLVGPEPIGNIYGLVDRKAGIAPPGWMVESWLADAATTSFPYEVKVTNLLAGKVYSVVYGQHGCDNIPAMWFSSENRAVVLSRGDARADLHYLDVTSAVVEHPKTWKWTADYGEALHEPVRNLLFIPQSDGYQLYDLTGKNYEKLIATILFSSPNQYAILLPNGMYAGSPGCENLLRLKAGNGNVDASSLAPWRNRPADVLKALGGDTEQIEILAKMTERWLKRIGHDSSKPEPTTEEIPILSVEMPPLWAKGPDIEVPIKITPQKSPVSNVSVRVNGVECANVMGQYLTKTNDGNLETVVSLRIAEGQNWIEVTAIDEMGRRSDSQRFRTILKEAQSPRRYVVALGVSKYHKSEFDLAFAAKDAKDLTSSLSNTDTESLILTDDEVDGDAIGKIQEFLAASQEDDEVILFCAGHGVLDANLDYVFARHDFDPDRPNETGIKLDDLIGAVGAGKSLKRLILLDTCHSGMIGEKEEALMASADFKLPDGVRSIKQRGMIVSKAGELTSGAKQRFIEEMFLLPGTHRGVNIIGASGGAEYALESGQWNNGVFTASVIEGLRDKKADWDKDEDVSVSELRDYLGQRIPELTGNAQKPSVVAFERDQDFNLAR
jgi:hypothetical protein